VKREEVAAKIEKEDVKKQKMKERAEELKKEDERETKNDE
jgi:hypothetical protein